MSWLDRLRGGFAKTAEKVADNLGGITSRAALDTSTLDDIEEALIASDLGPEASHRIREAIARQTFERLDERGLRSILAEEIEKILAPVAKPLEVYGFPRPHVILVIGVNGSGKTTTIGKLAKWLKEQDYGVLLAAGDTFRAAAIEQLQVWGDRVGAPVIAGKEGGDAAGIVFDGVKQATATGEDVLIVDTAGRLQNKSHLMEELSKIRHRWLTRAARSPSRPGGHLPDRSRADLAAVKNPTIDSLKGNLKTLNELHERLQFMLKELEDLIKEQQSAAMKSNRALAIGEQELMRVGNHDAT